jgi:nitrate/nitrite transporter NarK
MLSTLYIVSILMILKGYIGKERDASRGLIIGLQHVYSGLSRFIPVLLFSSIGLAIGSNVNALILDSKLRDLFSIFNTGFELRIFYGFFCGTLPVLLGSPLRLIIGRLVDKGYEKTMFTASILTYLILYLILPHTQPVIFIILWMLPVYPFYDTSIYAIISRSTSRYEATVTGFISTINSLAGLSLLLLNSTVPINNPAAYSIQILLFLGVPIMLTAMSTRRIKPLNTLSVIHN